MSRLPEELVAYHAAGKPLSCEIAVQPWICEFWPIDEILSHNREYEVETYAPGYLGFGTSGGGGMYAFSPRRSIVCLAFYRNEP